LGAIARGKGIKSAKNVFESLRSMGLLVRPVDTYPLPEHLRFTIGRRDEMERVAAALLQIIGN
jgi:histidinol-phosphate/aromatic aminotransferase/cobyric acid decarboxylase-like protein